MKLKTCRGVGEDHEASRFATEERRELPDRAHEVGQKEAVAEAQGLLLGDVAPRRRALHRDAAYLGAPQSRKERFFFKIKKGNCTKRSNGVNADAAAGHAVVLRCEFGKRRLTAPNAPWLRKVQRSRSSMNWPRMPLPKGGGGVENRASSLSHCLCSLSSERDDSRCVSRYALKSASGSRTRASTSMFWNDPN